MKKKSNNIEMKIYELLGVKVFRKMAFGLRDTLFFPFTFWMGKERRKDLLYNTASNYIMKKGHGLQDLRDFKKELRLNAGIHIVALITCLPNFLRVIGGVASLSTTIINLTCVGINIYCIMLQRYNNIRINQVLEKGAAREQKKKDEICEEIIKDNQISNDLTHKIVNKKDKEKTITFEEFLQTATLQQLKDYKESLEYAKRYYDYLQQVDSDSQIDIKIPLEKGKTLKLEIKTNQSAKI